MSDQNSDSDSGEDIRFDGNCTVDVSAAQDESVRRQIRRQYRDLNRETQAKMETLDETGPQQVKNLIERSDDLFSQVTMTREAALDSQQMHLCAQMLKRNAEALSANLTEFKPFEFAEKLIGLLGNPMESDQTNDTSVDVIPQETWIEFGREVAYMFKKAPPFHFMYGSFEVNEVQKEQKRRMRVRDEVAKVVVPKQVSEIQKSEQETTTEEVEKVLGILKALYTTHKEPLCYFAFAVDPHSYARTVENIFHISFLIRDGLVGIYWDEHKLPVIWPTNDVEEAKRTNKAGQYVSALTVTEWEDIILSFEITKPCIKPRFKI